MAAIHKGESAVNSEWPDNTIIISYCAHAVNTQWLMPTCNVATAEAAYIQ